MKVLRSSIFRAICAIVIGVLLISKPDSTVQWITVSIGVIFFLSGVISCAAYFNAVRNTDNTEVYDSDGNRITAGKPVFPIAGIGSILLGLVLALIPGIFVKSLMYVLGAMLILCSASQFVSLIAARRSFRIPVLFWIFPSIVMLAGVVVIVKPMETAGLPLVITGWSMLLYGITECISTLKMHREKRKLVKNKGIYEDVRPEE